MRDLAGSIAGLRNIWDRGPGMHKEPDDLARYQHVIDTVRPAVVVETGLYYGGSLLWFAERVPHVVTIENNIGHVQNYRANRFGLGPPAANGHIFIGDSVRYAGQVLAKAFDLAGDAPVLVVLDSDHGTEHVYQEIMHYWLGPTPGSYLVVEDGILHYMPKGDYPVGNWFAGDPLEAIDRALEDPSFSARFARDIELEDIRPTTQHPGGWLRRVG